MKNKIKLLLLLGVCVLAIIPIVNGSNVTTSLTTTLTTITTTIEENAKSELSILLEEKFGIALTTFLSIIAGGIALFGTCFKAISKIKKSISSILENTQGVVKDVKESGDISSKNLIAIVSATKDAISLYNDSREELTKQLEGFVEYKKSVESSFEQLTTEMNSLVEMFALITTNNVEQVQSGVASAIMTEVENMKLKIEEIKNK